MSRLNSNARLSVGLVLVAAVSLTWAQGRDPGPMNSITSAGVNSNKLLDISVPSVNDPHAVDLLFKEGDEITSILDELNKKGFHIEYKKKHFLPTMTLVSLPQETEIDAVLREILEPWNFNVYRTPFGKVVVTPDKKKKVQVSMQGEAQKQ
jgi:hypothetical protein